MERGLVELILTVCPLDSTFLRAIVFMTQEVSEAVVPLMAQTALLDMSATKKLMIGKSLAATVRTQLRLQKPQKRRQAEAVMVAAVAVERRKAPSIIRGVVLTPTVETRVAQVASAPQAVKVATALS